MFRTTALILLLFTLLFNGCFTIPNRFSKLAPGTWRATLLLDGKRQLTAEQAKGDVPATVEFEEVTEGELPFTFEVTYPTPDSFYIEIINGKERIKVTDIKYGLDRRTAKDTVIINFPIYDSYIRAIYEEDIMEGEWVVTSKKDYQIPFVARNGKGHRFTELRKTPKIDLTGRWEVTFGIDGDDPYPAIGEFEQKGNELTGTFLTETGDYRYLAGTVQDNKIYLSTFDGSHAFLFEAKIQEDETLLGSFRSGKHYKTLWSARRNSNVILADPDTMTYLKPGFDEITFEFPNSEGKMVSLKDSEYEGKVKLVQIFGTWCPNCKDETEFLTQYLKNNPNPDLAVIGLGFERYKEQDKALATLARYKKKMDIPYPLLHAGSSRKSEAAKSLPMLNKIISYPTLIFIDRNNQVRKIHTGFSGPATSQYAEFEEEFKAVVKELLAESPTPSES